MNQKRRMNIGMVLLLGAMPLAATAQELPVAPNGSATTWRNVEINGGGFVSGLIFNASERGLLYARTDIGGAYRWNTETKRWIPLTDHFGPDDWNLYGVESIATDAADPRRVYLSLGTYTNDWAGNGALLRSADRGQSWQRTNLPFKNGGNEPGRGMGEKLVVHPRDSKTLFLGTRRNGLWKSSDFGATWNKVTDFPAPDNENGFGVAFLTFDGGGTLYAGVASNAACLFSSNDGGATWKAVEGAPQGMFPHHGVFASDGTFYMTTSNGEGPNGVTDGAVWKRSVAGDWTKISPDAGTGFGYAGLAVDARAPRTLMVSTLDRWALGDDLFRSTDGGATWKSIKAKSTRDSSAAPYLNWGRPEAELGHWIGDVEIDPFDSNRALYTTGATIWGSDDTGNVDVDQTSHWSVRAAGIEEVSVSKLISPPFGPHLVSGMRDIGGFVHDDLSVSPRGGMMTDPRLSRNEGLDFAQMKPTLLVRTGDGNGGFSLDSGQSWRPFPAKPGVDMDQGPVAVSADGNAWVWSSNKERAFVTRDSAATWTVCEGLPPQARVISDRALPAVFYALDVANKQLLVSTDGGVHFAPRGGAIPDGVSKIAASVKEGHLWLLGSSGLLASSDGGQNWSKVEAVSASEAIGFGKAAPGAPDEAVYLVGTLGGVRGVFRSDDSGKNWVRINDDKHQWGYIGQSITGDPRVYGRVFLATNGRGILCGDLPFSVPQLRIF